MFSSHKDVERTGENQIEGRRGKGKKYDRVSLGVSNPRFFFSEGVQQREKTESSIVCRGKSADRELERMRERRTELSMVTPSGHRAWEEN